MTRKVCAIVVGPELIERQHWSPAVAAEFTVDVAGATHVGRVRTHNEDAWSAVPPVFVVADGMGGHAAGDVASRLVIEAFAGLSGADDVTLTDIEACIRGAQDAIDDLGRELAGAPGSTVVVAALTQVDGVPFWLIANVGDSRAYVWRRGELEQVSRDHSVVQGLIDSGEIGSDEARHHPERHVITRAIGALEHAVAEFAMIPVVAGARLLLCTDGLTGEVGDDEINQILSTVASSADAAGALIDVALARGGHDNVTVVIADSIGSAAQAEDTLRRVGELDEDTVRTANR